MNQQPTYETLLTRKLEQVPLPDMADSIWSAIDTALGPPPPPATDTTPGNKPSSGGNPAGGKWLYIAIPSGIIVLVAVLLLQQQKQNTQRPQKELPVVPADTLQQQLPEPGSSQPPPLNPLKEDRNTIAIPPDSLFNIPADTIQQDPVIPIPDKKINADTVTTQSVIRADSLQVPPAAKPRGVKGIMDKDYKIITEKKDSGRKQR